MATYQHDYSAFRDEVLNAAWMEAGMRSLAVRVAGAAEASAPVETGEYAASFDVESGRHGGIDRDRAFGRVTNNDPAALSIEFGTAESEGHGATPAHYTLTRALDTLR